MKPATGWKIEETRVDMSAECYPEDDAKRLANKNHHTQMTEPSLSHSILQKVTATTICAGHEQPSSSSQKHFHNVYQAEEYLGSTIAIKVFQMPFLPFH
jgi:hypothetical protein